MFCHFRVILYSKSYELFFCALIQTQRDHLWVTHLYFNGTGRKNSVTGTDEEAVCDFGSFWCWETKTGVQTDTVYTHATTPTNSISTSFSLSLCFFLIHTHTHTPLLQTSQEATVASAYTSQDQLWLLDCIIWKKKSDGKEKPQRSWCW